MNRDFVYMCVVYIVHYINLSEHKNLLLCFYLFQGLIPRIVLTRYKIHNKEENIEASQGAVTDNGKCF